MHFALFLYKRSVYCFFSLFRLLLIRVIFMDNKKTGELIFKLRSEKGLTQKQLADMLNVSDKAVSKWERGQGLPDVSLLPELGAIFGVNIEGLLGGGLNVNSFATGNMKKVKFYVCPICGNITICTGSAEITCCSRKIGEVIPRKADESHTLEINAVEDEWFISSPHAMLTV